MPACVTGMGVFSPAGTSVPHLRAGILEGRSAVKALAPEPEFGLGRLAGARFEGDVSVPGIEPSSLRYLDRTSLMSLCSAQQALAQAGLRFEQPRNDVPVLWGCGMGGAVTLDAAYADLLRHSRKRVRPTSIPYAMPSAPAFHLGHHLNARGPSITLSVACASSALAIAQGLVAIERGEADIALVGGVESMMTPAVLRGWQMAGAVCAADAACPEQSCRPFSAGRSGFAIAEGAACLVLESEAHAASRGAKVLGRVLSYGHTTDAIHISRPDAQAQVEAMQQALRRAGLVPADVKYVNAHGTGTVVGDVVELQSVRAALGREASRVALSSTKNLHGHLIAAAGAFETIVTLEALRAGVAPGNHFLRDPAPEAEGLHLPTVNLPMPAGRLVALTNSFAFGGVNACLALETVFQQAAGRS